MTTLCGKCGKKEPGCDCRPLAIPDSGNRRGHDQLRALINSGRLFIPRDCVNLVEEIKGYRYKSDNDIDLSA